MRFLLLIFLFGMLHVLSSGPALKHSPSSPTKIVKSTIASPTPTNAIEPGATNIILQSKDGGQTWQDISPGLPGNEQPDDFFAGASELYLRINEAMYRSKNDLETPVWQRVTTLDPRCSSIVFNHDRAVAYNFDGLVYQEMPSTRSWWPLYANFKKPMLRTVFETSDGTVFMGFDSGLYKSADQGQSWKCIQNGGWVMDIAEAKGVLIATSQKGIIRSTDNGEHWESVISEGGVGIAIEHIEGSGFAAISFSTKTQSRRIRISWDNGETWSAIDDGLPPSLSISSIKHMGTYLICGHPDGIFRSSDMGKTWKMVHESVDKSEFKYGITWDAIGSSGPGKVFKIYASGNVLYAVAKSAGC